MQIQRVQEQVTTGIVSPRQRSWKMALRQVQAFSFTAPALVLLAIFLIYPIGYVVFLSFQRWDLLGTPQFIGLQNYNTILFKDPAFLQSVGATVLFVVLAVPTQVGLGLFLAILLLTAAPTFAQTTLILQDANATTLRGGTYADTNFGSADIMETRASADPLPHLWTSCVADCTNH